MEKKLKVVWVTQVSNKKIRNRLIFDENVLDRIFRKLFHRTKAKHTDTSQWITNGLNEYENIKDIELHLIAPHIDIKGMQEFEMDGINYHFFRSEDDPSFLSRIFRKPKINPAYLINRKVIKGFINKIQPDIVHVIGAENPKYSLSALDIDTEAIPLVVSLQTLLSFPGVKERTPIPANVYDYRSACEREVLRHTRYIGSRNKMFQEYVWDKINTNAIFLHTTLFLGEILYLGVNPKKYDVIYFAKDISKACDIALKTMSEIVRRKPAAKMCIIGGCRSDYKISFDVMLESLCLKDNVQYLGSLPTHDDVLQALRSAKVALLPVKVDSVTGTMREAMANGIPVVTTHSVWGTASLNEVRQSAFIEEQDDFAALAQDVISLLDDEYLYKSIRENGYKTCSERYSNASFAKTQNEIYYALLESKIKKTPIPLELSSNNPIL